MGSKPRAKGSRPGDIPDLNEYEVEQIKKNTKWRKVKGPRAWRPKEVGEELVGYYSGRTLRDGKFGQYELVMVHVPRQGQFMVSGIKVIQLIDSARVHHNDLIRIVWGGYKELGDDKKMKVFEVYVEAREGENNG